MKIIRKTKHTLTEDEEEEVPTEVKSLSNQNQREDKRMKRRRK